MLPLFAAVAGVWWLTKAKGAFNDKQQQRVNEQLIKDAAWKTSWLDASAAQRQKKADQLNRADAWSKRRLAAEAAQRRKEAADRAQAAAFKQEMADEQAAEDQTLADQLSEEIIWRKIWEQSPQALKQKEANQLADAAAHKAAQAAAQAAKKQREADDRIKAEAARQERANAQAAQQGANRAKDTAEEKARAKLKAMLSLANADLPQFLRDIGIDVAPVPAGRLTQATKDVVKKAHKSAKIFFHPDKTLQSASDYDRAYRQEISKRLNGWNMAKYN